MGDVERVEWQCTDTAERRRGGTEKVQVGKGGTLRIHFSTH